MSTQRTVREFARDWLLGASTTSPDSISTTDDSLSIVSTTTIDEELDVAAECYKQAQADDAERIIFAIRDRRADESAIADGLRERGVPLGVAPGIAPRDDPVVDELLQVATVVVSPDDVPSVVRNELDARAESSLSIEEVFAQLASAGTLREALEWWIIETELYDRLLRAADGVHHDGSPEGTISQQSSSNHINLVLEVAETLDEAGAALDGHLSDPERLVDAIENGVMNSRGSLARSGERIPMDTTVEMKRMAELKVERQADIVVALEVTEALIDDVPGQRAFAVEPSLADHPDTPGVTAVSKDAAEETFGPVEYIDDGKRAWFAGLGRRSLGNAIGAASDRAVLVTREGATKDLSTKPSRTVVELHERLEIEAVSAEKFFKRASKSTGTAASDADSDHVEGLLKQLQSQMNASHNGEEVTVSDDAALRSVVEQLEDAVHNGDLSDEQLRELVLAVASLRASAENTNS